MSKQEEQRLETLRDAVTKLPRARQDYVIGYADAVRDIARQKEGEKEGSE